MNVIEWYSEVEKLKSQLTLAGVENLDLSRKEWSVVVFNLLPFNSSSLASLNLRYDFVFTWAQCKTF